MFDKDIEAWLKELNNDYPESSVHQPPQEELTIKKEDELTEKEELTIDKKEELTTNRKKNPRKRIRTLMTTLRSLRYDPNKKEDQLTEKAKEYIVVNNIKPRVAKKNKERNLMIQNDQLPNMTMFDCGQGLSKWPIPRETCIFSGMVTTPSSSRKRKTKEPGKKEESKGSKKKYTRKNGECKKLIPFFTNEQKSMLKNNPRKSFEELGRVSFRYVKCNPPQLHCPHCEKINTIDETNCQFCNGLLEEILK
jgi:hypothetical protein